MPQKAIILSNKAKRAMSKPPTGTTQSKPADVQSCSSHPVHIPRHTRVYGL
jgi:hypothetical protein